MRGLAGKVAVVTGGTRGIGRAIVLELVRCGAIVAFNYASRDELCAQLEEEAAGLGQRARGWRVDVADFEAVTRMVAEVREHLGPIEFLVNNAGVTLNKLLMSTTRDEWKAVMDVNLDSVFHFSRASIVAMMKAKRGAIVNVSSVSGVSGTPGQCAYAASKAGIIGFTKALAREVARLGIRVNTLALGYTETDMVAAMPAKARTAALGGIPLGRFATPEEAATAATFLLSDDASYITGHVLHVDGGLAA